MSAAVRTVMGLVAFGWLLWSITFAGLTMFLYLGTGEGAWDGHLAYAVGLIGMVPFIGGIIASFAADAVHGWGFFHAAFNFLGFMIPAIIAAMSSE
ncbi:hypothetical protein [Novosphingobium sp. BW1]|uniref:hypothetical protein n=1 Tax=Novosphingobium sp. BW1 TaxID=2592621 RepID=UPI0011DEE77F|nr:hypothetical protein [Novosphingobium sp. BW1]TYC78521.1 hypothetical protein FMM79_21055 [Novosphingobium sp. BW1]